MTHRILVVTGPHEGVGKTALAVNLAACQARLARGPVLVVDSDPLCRGEAAQMAGLPAGQAGPAHSQGAGSPGPSALELIEQLADKRASLPMLRGRVPVNHHNVGVIAMASQWRDAERLTPERWGFFLEAFSQLYDLVVDIEVLSPLKMGALDMADGVVWSFLPEALSVKSTLQHMAMLQQQKFGFQKFVLVLNQADRADGFNPRHIAQGLSRFEKEVSLQLPYEPELIRLVNQERPVILDQARSPYAKSAAQLLDKLPKPTRESAYDFTAAPGLAPGSDGPEAGRSAIPQNQVVDKMLEEKRRRWNSLKQRIHRDLVEELNIRRVDLDTKGDPVRERQLRTHVESTVNSLVAKEREATLSREERERLVKELVDEALGLGPLEELLADATITEIMVNRYDQVYVERRGKIALSGKRFIDDNHVVQVIRRIISPLGRRIDESVPMVDARLKDGSRVNAIIPPLAVQGPSLTIRRFPEKAFSPEDLVRLGAMTRPMVEFLKVCVLGKKNMIISGGTGTGKTTILNMLSGFIPNDERIITVEDTAELRMQQEHVVRLESRPANIEGQGQVAIRDLVKNSLRMRPDRIVVGECRGGEALDMLQAMNTGHEGSLTTIHANSPRDAFNRLETLCLMAGMELPVWALREQIRSAVHIVVQLSRLQDGTRKVTRVTEVTGRDEESILTQDLFLFVQDSVDDQGRVAGHHEAAGNIPKFFPELKAKGLNMDVGAFSGAPRS